MITTLTQNLLTYFNGELPDLNGCRNYLESYVPIALWGIVYDNALKHVGEIHETPEMV